MLLLRSVLGLGTGLKKINMAIWDNLKHFNRHENWGDPDKINGLLLLTLDSLREAIDRPFVIHNAYSLSGHSEKSQHYVGNAVDFHAEEENFGLTCNSMITCLSDMQISHKVGFGIYPDWEYPGFHLDVRGTMARWGQIDMKYVSIQTALRRIYESH